MKDSPEGERKGMVDEEQQIEDTFSKQDLKKLGHVVRDQYSFVRKTHAE